jgi:uncharacterized protein (UPF0335 family)
MTAQSPALSPDTAPRRVSNTGGIARDQLRSIVERIERMQEEAAGLASDIKDIFAEAKGNGFDVPTLRRIIALRKQDASERDEAAHLLDTYCRALGMQTSFNFEEDADGGQ